MDIKFAQLPRSIQDHYSTREHEISRISVNCSGDRDVYIVRMHAFGATDKWDFRGEPGKRRWTLMG